MDVLSEGLRLMVVGMSVVFSFLILLVVAMKASAAFFKRFAHLFPEEQKPTTGLQRVAEDNHADIAVAIAAVKAYTKA
jgi:oxaloacetate decarboxylase (Na+ extruding) subunit gamma